MGRKNVATCPRVAELHVYELQFLLLHSAGLLWCHWFSFSLGTNAWALVRLDLRPQQRVRQPARRALPCNSHDRFHRQHKIAVADLPSSQFLNCADSSLDSASANTILV